jgi:rsbT co-antagonist protein RsbR
MENQPSPPRSRGGYLETLLTSSPFAIMAIDANGKITFANKEAANLAERELHELIGQNISIMYENVEVARETNRKLFQNKGVIHNYASNAITKSGKLVPIHISSAQMYDDSGKYAGAIGFFETYHPWEGAEAKLKTYAEDLEKKLAQQQDYGAPVFQLYPGLTAVVIAGTLSLSRFEQIVSSLMKYLETNKTRSLLIDLSTVGVMDTEVADKLAKTLRTIHLLGVQSVLSGMNLTIAKAIEPHLKDLNSVKFFSYMEPALQAALNNVNCEIRRKG